MPDLAPQIRYVALDETRNIAVDCRGKLDTGELLTGTPTITEVTTTDLTLTNKAVSTAALVVNGSIVPIGMAIQFRVAPGATTGDYYVSIVCGTDAGQTIKGRGLIKVIA